MHKQLQGIKKEPVFQELVLPFKGTLGQIFCSRGHPLENSRGRPVEFTGRPVKSTGRPLEFSRGRPLEQKIWPNIPIAVSL